ncbi:MAG: patatin-like phospholipase family protein [Myxococcota bacterium]
MKTAFVFAGGGSLGAVEVGMLQALVGREPTPDFVAGSSVGAINAAYFAARPDAEGVARLAAIWRRLRSRDVFPLKPLHGFLGFIGRRPSLLDAEPLRALLERELPYRLFEEAALPCHVVATDVLDGGRVVISKGPVVDALLASAAIPGVFPPRRCGDKQLIDGGVSANTPLAAAVERGARRIVVLPTGFSCALPEPPSGALAMALHAITLLVARQLVSDVLHFQDRAEIFVVPPLCPIESSAYDFSASAALIDRAAANTEAWIATRGLERPGVPHALAQHTHELF